MLNDSRALLRQTGRSSFRMILDFMEGEVFDGLIPTLNRCKEQGVPDEGVCFECNNGEKWIGVHVYFLRKGGGL